MASKNGMRTRERICYLIGKYQCRLEDERIRDQERKIYENILEDLRHLLETAMQEGLQS
jgi:hypothetical protein